MKATITSHRNVPSPDMARAGKLDTMIMFTVDGGDSDVVIVPGTDPTDAQITAAINAQLEARGKRVGRTFDV